MEAIKRRYVVDEHDRRIAVQLDLETFERLVGLLEDHALAESMAETRDDEILDLDAARSYYAGLDKAL